MTPVKGSSTAPKMRRRACERAGSEVDQGAGVAAAGRSPTHMSILHAIGRSTSHGFLLYFWSFAGCCANCVEDNHLANGCLVRAASITCLIASTVTWACSLFHSSPEWVAPSMTR